MIFPLLLIFFLYLPKAIVFFGLYVRFRKLEVCSGDQLPTVSVLIPARNEADNIINCLNALLLLEYPVDKLQVLVGDDQSTDDTAKLVTEFADQHKQFHLKSIKEDYKGLVARSNVLAQLANEASGDYLVFLDADMQPKPAWLQHMVSPTLNGYQLVSGYTKVSGRGWLARMQAFDWYNVLAWLKVAADLGEPGTALGNNMLMSKQAYRKVGGYEAVGPTFTEDNDLTLALRQNGHRLFQVTSPAYATTEPVSGLNALLMQRSRWMQGAFKQPLYKLLPVLLSRTFVFVSLIICIWSYKWGVAFLVHNVIMDVAIAVMMYAKSKVKTNIFYALAAPVFNSVLDTFTLLSYPWNKQVTWKGRKL